MIERVFSIDFYTIARSRGKEQLTTINLSCNINSNPLTDKWECLMLVIRNGSLNEIVFAVMGELFERIMIQDYGPKKDEFYIIDNLHSSLDSVDISLQKRPKIKWPSPFGYTRRFTRMRSYKGRR